MKRALALALLALAVGAGAAQAAGPGVGIGPYGGYNIALIQQDTGNGSVFGVRAPVNLIPLITVEPYLRTSNLGDMIVTGDTSRKFASATIGINYNLMSGK